MDKKKYKEFEFVCEDDASENKLIEYIDSLGKNPIELPDVSPENYERWHCDYNFKGVLYLKLPESVKKLGKCVFAQSNIVNLEAPNVLLVDELCFYNTKDLESVTFPNCTHLCTTDEYGNFTDGSDAFNHSHVVNLIIPKVEYVGRYAFYDMPNITSLNLPSLKDIMPHAIYGSKNLESVNLGNLVHAGFATTCMNPSLIKIIANRLETKDEDAFFGNSENCNEIHVKIVENDKNLLNLDNNLIKIAEMEDDLEIKYNFEYHGFRYSFIDDLNDGEIYELNKNIKELIDKWLDKREVLTSSNSDKDESAEDVLKKLKHIELPSEIEQIGDYAFSKCYDLKSFVALGVKKVCDHAFYCDAELGYIDLPACENLECDAFNGTAFNYGDSKVARINVRNVKKVGKHAFWQTGFTVINLPQCEDFEISAIEENLYLQKLVVSNVYNEKAFIKNPNIKIMEISNSTYFDASQK